MATLVLTLTIALVGSCSEPYSSQDVPKSDATPSSERQITYEYLLGSFDADRPGYGNETSGGLTIDQPMAYALIATSASLAGDEVLAQDSCDWLVGNAESSDDPAWGLGWAWDAFGDGSVNPMDTSYGITTALAIEALANCDGLDEAEPVYLDTAVRALDYYRQFTTKTDAGVFFWYSDRPADAHQVHNVSAMLMGQYALVGEKVGNEEFQSLAVQALQELAAKAQTDKPYVTWPYSELEGSGGNDLVHAAYIAYGIALTQRVCNCPTLIEESRLSEYLEQFFDEDGVLLDFIPDENPRDVTLRARAWGVGMAAYTFEELNAHDSANRSMQLVADYEFAPSQFSFFYGGELSSPRSNAHLLLGAARNEKVNR